MKGKIGLEEHFAIPDTVMDSKGFLPERVWADSWLWKNHPDWLLGQNTDQRLVPGQSVNVGVTLNQIAGATVVPRDAVNVGPDSSYVYVVDKDNVVSSKTVKVLNDDGTVKIAASSDAKSAADHAASKRSTSCVASLTRRAPAA